MKKRYGLPLIVLGLALLLVALHLALPYLVRDYLNDKLATMGDYHGRIERVGLAWWRGAYRIEGLKIVKQEGRIPVPFLDAPAINLAVSWDSLWHDRAVVARAVFERPELNFVDGDTAKDSQSGEGVDWREQLEKLLPITLNEVRIEDGRLAFRNFQSDPPVNLQATEVNALLHNLTNVEGSGGQGRVARLEAKAKVLGQAPLETSARFDPFDEWRDFEWRLRISGVELRRLNAFSRAYGRFDFNAGQGDLVLEVETNNFRLDGYVKPLLKDVDVFDWQQDVEEEKGFLRGLWEALVGGGQTVLKNQRKDQFATRIELSGTLEQPDISPLQAFATILRNAFVQAFTPRFERALEEEEKG